MNKATLYPFIWADEDGKHLVWLPAPEGWDEREGAITPADIEALQQEALSGRLFGWWLDGAKDEGEDDNERT